MLLILTASPSLSHQKPSGNEQGRSDSLIVYPQKLSAKEPWEKFVSFPGKIVVFPVKLTYFIIQESATQISRANFYPVIKEWFSFDIKPWGLSPSYSSRHGAGFSFYRRDLINQDSKISLKITKGFKSRQRYRLKFEKLNLAESGFKTDVFVQYRLLSTESFFGIGKNSSEAEKSNYALDQITAEALFYRNLSKSRFELNLGYDINRIKPGRDPHYPSTADIFTGRQIPGLKDEIGIARIMMEYFYKSLDSSIRPQSGTSLSLRGGVFKDFKENEYGFWKLSADFRQYIHLFYYRTLVLRLAAERNISLSGKKIPFYYMSTLGSWETIRGYTRGRFYDNDMLIGSLEYRYPVRRNIDTGLFIDAGQVSSDIFKNLSFGDLNYCCGLMLNIWSGSAFSLRTAVGFSKERTRFNVQLNSEF